MSKKEITKRTNLSFCVRKNGKEIDTCHTRSKRRFYNRIGTINWHDGGIKVYLRINYGKIFTNTGKKENFWNDGEYENENDFNLALKAFLEDC